MIFSKNDFYLISISSYYYFVFYLEKLKHDKNIPSLNYREREKREFCLKVKIFLALKN